MVCSSRFLILASSWFSFLRRVLLIMRLFTGGLRLALLIYCFVGLTGCGEDNEAFIKQQASKAKGTIPGSRTAQAQDQAEYYEITPGVRARVRVADRYRTKAKVILDRRSSRWRSLAKESPTDASESLCLCNLSIGLTCSGRFCPKPS